MVFLEVGFVEVEPGPSRWRPQLQGRLFRPASLARMSLPQAMGAVLASLGQEHGCSPLPASRQGKHDERHQAYRSVRHENTRKKDETLAQYSMRRLRDFTSHGVILPAEFRVAMMREGAGLTEQGQQNLTALLQGKDDDVDHLASTLAKMDIRADRLSGYATVDYADQEDYDSFMAVDDEDTDEDDGEDANEDEAILAELEDLNLSEEQAVYAFALVEGETAPGRKTSCSRLRQRRTGFLCQGRLGRASTRSQWRESRTAVYSESLGEPGKTCKLCGRKGRWAEDCRSSRPATGQEAARSSGFCYLGPSSATSAASAVSMFSMLMSEAFHGYGCRDIYFGEMLGSFLTLSSGTAILDIGATQDLIGVAALAALEHELERVGLDYRSPDGFLCSHGHRRPGQDGQISAVQSLKFRLNMRVEASGHRTIPLVEWAGGPFPVPEAAKQQYGLAEDAFMKKGAGASSRYTKERTSQCGSASLQVHPSVCGEQVSECASCDIEGAVILLGEAQAIGRSRATCSATSEPSACAEEIELIPGSCSTGNGQHKLSP